MGLFNFGAKSEEKIQQIIEGNFGGYASALCAPLKSVAKLCDILNCPAHFALSRGPLEGNTYSLRLSSGVFYAEDDLSILQYIMSQSEEDQIVSFQNRFGLSEEDVRRLYVGGLEYTFNEDDDALEFVCDDFMSYLPGTESKYHLKAFGRVLQKELPQAHIKVDDMMIFVMLNGNEQGKYEEKK